MEDKRDIIVLYIDRDNGNALHQILLNDLEIAKISNEITNIFAAKKSAVMVSETKLKLYKEASENESKRNNR